MLEEFLYDAIFVPEDVAAPPKDIIYSPQLWLYIDKFGKVNGDRCLVADLGRRIVGAVWTRFMDDYGHIDDRTPSLAISVSADYRRLGIGTALMKEMIRELRASDVEAVSLSVDKRNYACKMYLKLGFAVYAENEEDYIMLLRL